MAFNMEDIERRINELQAIKAESFTQSPEEASKIAATIRDIKHEKRVVEIKIEKLLTDYTQRFGIPLIVEVNIVDVESFNGLCGAVYQVEAEGVIQ